MLRTGIIGEGTFGRVYSATSPDTNRNYAVKRNLTENEVSFIGVARETDMLMKLRGHPHIIHLAKIAFGHPFKDSCFSPLQGEDRISQKDDMLHFVFHKANYDMHNYIYNTTNINFALTKRYMVCMLLGLEYMHSKKIIHRDLKPSNVLIFGEDVDVLGQNNVAKIGDFGFSKPYTYQGTMTPNVITSWYRPPEIALGYDHYDYKSDIWSLGCIFFELLAKRALLAKVPENNDEILSTILGILPEALPLRTMRDLVKSNKWRKVKLTPLHNPKVRRSFAKQINLSIILERKFNLEAGNFSSFCDLLSHMLCFDWENRYNASQCLNHPFFSDYSSLIKLTREAYPLTPPEYEKLSIRNCIERKWMIESVTAIVNSRAVYNWYNHRIIFQAIALFDIYLDYIFKKVEIEPNAVESEYRGLIHTRGDVEIRFRTFIYLGIKYFSTLQLPIPVETIFPNETDGENDIRKIAEQFEGGFINTCLEFNIYRNTIYEAADEFGDILDESTIIRLLIFYGLNYSLNGLTAYQIYKYYRTHLKDATIEQLMTDIDPNLLDSPPITIPILNPVN